MRIILIALAGIVTYFATPYWGEENNPDRELMIQKAVLNVLEQAHFDPKDINDQFSEQVYTDFLETIDGRKRFLTQSDLDQLAPYKTELDDQFLNGTLEFFDLAVTLLSKRVIQVEGIYKELLAQPFDFDMDEGFEFDPDKKQFARDETELKEIWRKSLKYDVLIKLESKLDKQKTEGEKKSQASLEEEARKAVLKNYNKWYKNFRKLRRSDRFEAYINSFTHIFDPHTDYYNPKEKQDFDISMGGKLEGIGARLRTDDDLTKVVSIVPGGPAWKGKELEVDDSILKVTQEEGEPVDVFGMRIDDVVSMIRGDKGTVVILTIQKPDGTVKDVKIERDIVNIEESFAKSAILDVQGGATQIGYIDLPKFYSSFEGPDGNSCAVDVAEELQKLKAQNVKGVILDLRSNGGGSLRDVVDMSGLFIEEGPIVQVKGRNREPYIHRDTDASVLYDGPLVVMINEFSASASEILAAALQDYNRALIVGSQSFGKGTVQRFVDLDRTIRGNSELKPLGELKLTMQKFFRINGGSTQQRGVTPDIILPDRYYKIDVGEREYPYSMEWTEIDSLEYSQEIYQIKDKNRLIAKSKARLESHEEFQLIDEMATTIAANKDETAYPLSLGKFQEYVENKEIENKKFDDIMKSPISQLSIANLKIDMASINFDETTIAKNMDWKSDLQKDIYLLETMAIINDMINGPSFTNNDLKK